MLYTVKLAFQAAMVEDARGYVGKIAFQAAMVEDASGKKLL